MRSTIHSALGSGHLSRHERQRLARTNAISRRAAASSPAAVPVKLAANDLELIDRLVRSDRAAVSSALLAVAGIGADETHRQAVLARVSESAGWAHAEGAISARKAEQIARHVALALGGRSAAA
jgi:hypothetical protein